MTWGNTAVEHRSAVPYNLLRRLPVEETIGARQGGRHRLSLVYGTRDLVVLGLGVMIGSGIFNIAGQEAATTAGPAVILSFGKVGIVALQQMIVVGTLFAFIFVSAGVLALRRSRPDLLRGFASGARR